MKVVFFSFNNIWLRDLAMSSPRGSASFLLAAVKHSTCEFFHSVVDGYLGCFQFFRMTNHAAADGDGDTVPTAEPPSVQQKSV